MSEPITIKQALDDFAATNHPQLLAIREEINSIVNADSDTVFKVAEERLSQLYHEAEQRGDETSMALAADAYNHVKELYQANDQLTGIAVASKAAMEKAVEERDELVDALESQDTSHPLIDSLVEDVREEAMYDFHEGADDYYSELHFDNAVENSMDALGITDYQIISRFVQLTMWGYVGYGTSLIPDEVLHEIGSFIAERLSPYVKPKTE